MACRSWEIVIALRVLQLLLHCGGTPSKGFLLFVPSSCLRLLGDLPTYLFCSICRLGTAISQGADPRRIS
ncbi:hypothetical protein ZWY2020_036782 [Hordeum vulgare]|nr:hypothetical protein ZWY2020_036782 [Hordeum vulgare]